MGNVFAQKPLKEIVRENQRMIKKSIRELEKEIKNLESQEKKLIADIKKHAKLNQMVTHSLLLFLHMYLLANPLQFATINRGQSKSWRRILSGLGTT
jgi:hypothetical protein